MTKHPETTHLNQLKALVARHTEGLAIAAIEEAIPILSRRTLNRRLAMLVERGDIRKVGRGAGVHYVPQLPTKTTSVVADNTVTELPLSSVARKLLTQVSRSLTARPPVGYKASFIDAYKPNRTAYLPERTRKHLLAIGKPIQVERAAGSFARDIMARLLIDLSWSSSRLEGNTYSRLDTQRLIEFGQAAEGKDAKETQMILNHKAAIEILVDGGDDVAVNRFTILNLHAVLSEELMSDPEASGRLRQRPVEISKSAYVPLGIPQKIEERFTNLISKASQIKDPFEQSFFLMVHLPYLQPFEDVNKRVARLAANIPLLEHNLCPLSFVDVPERTYILGTLAVYETRQVELLRDVYVWAYERSCQKYVVVRDSVVEPDLFRMKHRHALSEVISTIVRTKQTPTRANIEKLASKVVNKTALPQFIKLTQTEFGRLYEGNVARYKLRLSEFRAWQQAQLRASKK